MGCTRSNRGVFEWAVETTYGDGGGAVPTWYRARLAEVPDDGTLGVESMQLEDVTATDIEGDVIRVPGPGTRKIKRYMRALQTATPDATYSESGQFVGHLDSDVLAHALGGKVHGGFGTAITGSTTTAVKLSSNGEAATFTGGQIVRVLSSTGRVAYGLVKSVATDTLTLHWALPFVPGNGTMAIGGRLLYKTEPTGSFGSRFKGENLDDIRYAYGSQVQSYKLTCEENKLLTWEADFFVARFADMVADQDHGGLTEADEDYPTPVQGRDGGLWAVPYNTSTDTFGTPIRLLGGLELDLGVESAAATGVHGDQPNGVSGLCTIRRKARLNCTAPSYINYSVGGSPAAGEGNYWQAAFQAHSRFGLIYWSGNGQAEVCIASPLVELAEEPRSADRDGRSIIPLSWKEVPFDQDAGSGDAKNSTLRVLFPVGDIIP